jgi:hypothetical protein
MKPLDAAPGATSTQPGPAEALAITARYLFGIGRPELARATADLALGEDENCAEAHSVRSVVHEHFGEWPEGLEHARRAAAAAPASAQLRYNLALSTLRLGDYRAGFTLMEARIDKPDWTGLAIAPSRAAERHRLLRPGGIAAGLRLLVIAEQGLGDCLAFARYLPLLAARGARVTLVCSPPLRPVFERVAGVEAVLSPPAAEPFAKINLSRAEFDAWVPLLSLPFHLGTEIATVPAWAPYLPVDDARVAAWRRRYESARYAAAPKVGLVFQANPASASAVDRSPAIGDLAPLLRLPGTEFVNLQGGEAGRRLAAAYPEMIDALKQEVPLDEFAAAVKATDLLVTIDTMAAHCAGGQGHPLWVMVPFSPHWYWGIAGAETPWYPSARLFRQGERGNWPKVVATIAEALARWRDQRPAAQGSSGRGGGEPAVAESAPDPI